MYYRDPYKFTVISRRARGAMAELTGPGFWATDPPHLYSHGKDPEDENVQENSVAIFEAALREHDFVVVTSYRGIW